MLKLITAATTLAVSVARAKERLRIDEADDDNDIEALIRAAAGVTEHRAGVTLQESAWELRLPCWPHGPHSCISIPIAPVREITGVSYLDEDGNEQTIAQGADTWNWERTPEGAVLWFASGFDFPDLAEHPFAVRVQLGAGFDDPAESGSGDDPELSLPASAETAVLFLVGHWFENREAVAGKQTYPVPSTFDLLIEGFRVFR